MRRVSSIVLERVMVVNLGRPQVTEERMILWIADWLKQGGESLHKPTPFQTRDGKF